MARSNLCIYMEKILKCSFSITEPNSLKLNLLRQWLILVPNVKLTCDLLSKATHLDCHIPI